MSLPEGGILIAAHPYKWSRLGRNRYYGAGDRVYELALDALELYHPHHDAESLAKVCKAMKKLGLPGTDGSDAHQVHDIGRCVTVFENKVCCEEDFIQEVRAGHIQVEKRF